MNKRLLWNFELTNQSPYDLGNLKTNEQNGKRWEKRFFWPENTIISLAPLSIDLQNFQNCKIKERLDTYYLFQDLNLKERREAIFYKPCLGKEADFLNFDSKINLSLKPQDFVLPGTQSLTVSQIFQNLNKPIKVDKVAFVFKLSLDPLIKLELARLQVQTQIYYSASLEGDSLTALNPIAKHLLKDTLSCDYVTFLKQIFHE